MSIFLNSPSLAGNSLYYLESSSTSQRVSIEFHDKRLERSTVDRCIEDLSRLLDVNGYISSSSGGARQDSIVSGAK